MSALQDRPKMNYYRVRFTRKKPVESRIYFVVAFEGTNKWEDLKDLKPIFAYKFPGWTFCYMSITEQEFDASIDEASEASLIDFDHRHPDELFKRIKSVCGNFFDPWRFT